MLKPDTSPPPLLSVRHLSVRFPVKNGPRAGWLQRRRAQLCAVNNVSLDLPAGKILGIVGESGCGKSTLARALIGLTPVSEGQILWLGRDLVGQKAHQWRAVRRDMQMIFQDPLASLDPRMPVGELIAEPLRAYYPRLTRQEVRERVQEMMHKVGLLPNLINRYPHEFSGGQCQRIGIARALILRPRLVICDEPVSALDVSVQAQVVNLLQSLQEEMGLTLLFIAHDLAIVRHIADSIAVMYLGHIVEQGSWRDVCDTPRHPYTRALMAAAPVPDPAAMRDRTLPLLDGDLPSPLALPGGCVFHTRCPLADDACTCQRPPLHGDTHQVACLKTAG